ncbi:ankyrin repeat domain-containing protein [Roseomonas frigidaquae]|uniref:Ankyrin repeat domain-containing protein n=1 Tax=Falsiroseomonas frigidaquae TaxID=487318 RepID=A0ABX1EUQ1_9PROT|nr:ankyrin repeat domain-containing protein [Falsiroseomonas frigidaquae]NKE44369.1 ankyrin repeat domain-containing protein [Falsiroseomonas frigidaquae]
MPFLAGLKLPSFPVMRASLRLSLLATLLAFPTLAPVVQAQGIIRPAETQRAPSVAAPALPGLAARRAPAPIPADAAAAGLSPNAALFDAIARGDLPAARDAVSRGANIESRNALGLSPLDAAVDQGRNEIAFYLLSARDRTRGSAPPPPSVPGQPSPAAAIAASLAAAPPPAAARSRAPMNTPPTLAAEPVGAQLWAGNGGAARPELGFLGFDAGRPAGASPPETAPRTTRRSRP